MKNTMMKTILAATIIGATLLTGCSKNAETEATESVAESTEESEEILRMQAEIEYLQSQLDAKNAKTEEISVASKEAGNITTGQAEVKEISEDSNIEQANNISMDELYSRYQTYVNDHGKTFRNVNSFKLINITDDDIPELLYADKNGLLGILVFDGTEVKLCAGNDNYHEIDRYGSLCDSEDSSVIVYYGEKSNRFAVYKYEKATDLKHSGTEEENNCFYEIDERGNLIDLTTTSKNIFNYDDALFMTKENLGLNSTREDYDMVNAEYYQGLDKSADMFGERLGTVEEAFEAYL